MTTKNQNQTTRLDGNPTECEITNTLKVRRIREIIQWYYKPPDERIIAPETVISHIYRVIKE